MGTAIVPGLEIPSLDLVKWIIIGISLIYVIFNVSFSYGPSKGTRLGMLGGPPTFPSAFPLFTHMWGVIKHGLGDHLSDLCVSQPWPISTVWFPGQTVHIVRPEHAKELVKTRNLSVSAAFNFAFGCAFGLSRATRKLMMDLDKQFFNDLSKLFNRELMAPSQTRPYAERVDQGFRQAFEMIPPNGQVRVKMADWVFDNLAGALGRAVWGEDGPFSEPEFQMHLRRFFRNLHLLQGPMSFLTPPEVRLSRAFVRDRLSRLLAVRASEPNSDEGTPASLLGGIDHILDHYGVRRDDRVDGWVMLIAGLIPSGSKVLTWCLYHILADRGIHATITAELHSLASAANNDSSGPLVFDMSRLHATCPQLVATWYEVLRVRGDFPIARYVHGDTVFASRYNVRKGSVLFVPVRPVHFDPTLWGTDSSDIEVFRPARFLNAAGQLDAAKIRLIRTFGVPEPRCPGRNLAFTVTLTALVRVLLTFEFSPTDDAEEHGGLRVPVACKSRSLGPNEAEGEKEIWLRRKVGVGSVTLVNDISLSTQKY